MRGAGSAARPWPDAAALLACRRVWRSEGSISIGLLFFQSESTWHPYKPSIRTYQDSRTAKTTDNNYDAVKLRSVRVLLRPTAATETSNTTRTKRHVRIATTLLHPCPPPVGHVWLHQSRAISTPVKKGDTSTTPTLEEMTGD